MVPGGHNMEVGVSAFEGDEAVVGDGESVAVVALLDITDGSSGVSKAVVGDGESAAVAALLDITDGSSGASDMDKTERDDGDVAVAAALPDADGPWGPSDMDETEGGDGGAKAWNLRETITTTTSNLMTMTHNWTRACKK